MTSPDRSFTAKAACRRVEFFDLDIASRTPAEETLVESRIEPIVEGGTFFPIELFDDLDQALLFCARAFRSEVVQHFEPKPGIEFGAADDGLYDTLGEWEGCEFLWRDRHRVIFERGTQGFASIVGSEFEVVVLGMFSHLFEHWFRRDPNAAMGV